MASKQKVGGAVNTTVGKGKGAGVTSLAMKQMGRNLARAKNQKGK